MPLLALSPYERPRKQLGPSHHRLSPLPSPHLPSQRETGTAASLRGRATAGGLGNGAALSHSLSGPKASFPKKGVLGEHAHPWYGARGTGRSPVGARGVEGLSACMAS